MTKFFSRFAQGKSGATAIEYGLIAALVAVVIIGGVTLTGDELQSNFDFIGNTLQGTAGGTVPAT